MNWNTKMMRTSFLLVSLVLLTASIAQARILWGPDEILVGTSNTHYLKYLRYMTVPIAKQTGATWESGNNANVAGKSPAEVQVIVNNIRALETDPVQQEIVETMRVSKDSFKMRDEKYAAARVLQRLDAIQMIQNFNRDHRYEYYTADSNPTPFKGNTTAPYWAPRLNRTDKTSEDFYFRQVSGTAYQAINALCSESAKTYGECHGALAASVWWGTASAMQKTQMWYGTEQQVGENAFNAFYPTNIPMDMLPGSLSLRRCLNPYSADGVNNPAFPPNEQELGVLIPGDWGGWKTANYGEIISKVIQSGGQQVNPFKKDKLIDADAAYIAQGENALYIGKNSIGTGLYEGLGSFAHNKTADEMRDELMSDYNEDLSKVIAKAKKSGGTLYGVSNIETIDETNKRSKIRFIGVQRPRF